MLRPLEGIEKAFGNPFFSSNVQFSIKLENSNLVDKVVKNFNKIFLGLRLKVVDGHYAKTSDDETIGGIMKLPMWIQDCKAACHWIEQNGTFPVDKRLTTIASNDRIVVVSTNHIAADSGFIMNAVEHSLDDDIVNAYKSDENLSPDEKMVPIPDSIAFKTEIERAERVKPNLHPNKLITSFPYDVNTKYLVDHSPKEIHFDDEIPIENLTCFDKKSKKPKQMNELLWTGITINQNAMAKIKEGSSYKRQPLALPIIVDTRKFADDPSKLNWRNTNCVTACNLLADPTDDMTIRDIFNLFRKDLNSHMKDGFYYWINNGNFTGEPGRAYGRNSGIGTVKINRPIMDFFLQAVFAVSDKVKFEHKDILGLNLFSFTKMTPKKSIFCPTFYYDSSNQLMRETLVLKEAFTHFITKVPIDTKYKDALDELQHFQQNLLNEI
ncbi:hypothetical protein M9Y10_018702 [Tritrichomonas musculus]|uniref:Uncharacterized protein n=1 Tax=Tritrichomonas musculus TaxID=1915356 RepID=A0ABR2HNG2_9EUKA